MAYAFSLGVDVTDDDERNITLTLIEKRARDTDEEPVYEMRRIEQRAASAEDDDELDALVEHVQDILADKPYTGRTAVIVNRTTDTGQAVLRAFDDRGLTPFGITVTGGDGTAEDPTTFFMAEPDLLRPLLAVHESDRLEWGSYHTEEASELAHGIQSYRAGIDQADIADEPVRDVQEAPDRWMDHAAFLFSAALACWFGEERAFNPTEALDDSIPTTGEAKRMIRPDTTS